MLSRKWTPYTWMIFVLSLLLLTAACVGLTSYLGPPLLSPFAPLNAQDVYILQSLRLPKYTLAALAGFALALSGTSFQSLLRNPLADPYILGISGGAALGFVAGTLFGLPAVILPAAGFVFALASLAAITWLARSVNGVHSQNLLLSGVIFNSFAFALVLLAHTLAPWGDSQQILGFLLGSLDVPDPKALALYAFLVASCAGVLFYKASELNLLLLPRAEAESLGFDAKKSQLIIFVAVSILVGATVSLCGLIGFIGLFIPHMIRIAFGSDHRLVLPLSGFAGALFLLFAEFSLTLFFHKSGFQTRLPIGVLTALGGAPVFAWLLRRFTQTRSHE